MIIRREEDYFFLKQSSLLVGKTLGEITNHLAPGIQTIALDKIAEDFIKAHGGIPAFKGYRGFPSTLCISVNDVVVHGIPSKTELKEGDIVSVDCGVKMNGYFGDFAYTFLIGEISQRKKSLVEVTKTSLLKGIEEAITSNTTGDIGYAVQSYVESNSMSVVRELVGHGVGRELHERPEVPNYGKKRKGERLLENMVICIEPMINLGKRGIVQANDGWTIRTIDGLPSAHFEHMVIVKTDFPEVLSTYEFIEENIKKNIWLNNRL